MDFEANAPVDIATNTLHWFAQIGHDFVENDERDDNGEGKRKGLILQMDMINKRKQTKRMNRK